MHLPPPGRLWRPLRVASVLLAALPLPAAAAELVVSPSGTYSFFALVAAVVIVLLLHEALESEQSAGPRDEQGDEHFREKFGTRSVARDNSVTGHDSRKSAA